MFQLLLLCMYPTLLPLYFYFSKISASPFDANMTHLQFSPYQALLGGAILGAATLARLFSFGTVTGISGLVTHAARVPAIFVGAPILTLGQKDIRAGHGNLSSQREFLLFKRHDHLWRCAHGCPLRDHPALVHRIPGSNSSCRLPR